MTKANKSETKANKSETKPEEVTMTEDKKETAIDKPAVQGLVAVLGDKNEKFMNVYSKQVKRAAANLPTPRTFQIIIDDLPEELADCVCEITKKIGGEMQGMYSSDDRPDFPELRLYHGTGNDPNRPERQVPGDFYTTAKESVGGTFTGAVLAIWEGRTMWGESDSGESTRMPVCSSMDRKVGGTFGDCGTCPHRPWKDGEPQACSNDVVAYMLTKDMKDIVKVRFAKTSEPGGRRLMRLLKRDPVLWGSWYTISAEQQTSKHDSSKRWYVMNVEKAEGDDRYTPEELHEFCKNMCTSLEASFILPSLAGVYRLAASAEDEEKSTEGTNSGGTLSVNDAEGDDSDYGSMDDDEEETK